MQAFLFGLIFLSFAGFAWAIHVENVSANDSQNAALAQATRCASVPVITSAILATYALTVGLVRSEQRFPWRTALRIATASILLATIGYYVPVNGMWRLGVLASCVIIYVCVLLATGDLRTAFRELFERAPRHTADQQA